jgi:hypothetical protein
MSVPVLWINFLSGLGAEIVPGNRHTEVSVCTLSMPGAFLPAAYFKPEDKEYDFISEWKPATACLFKLISMLQFSGTVPMIDVMEYSKWLVPS